tara:strand:+ start:2073 stop:2576 length:504 start_codon:yes stop_codon:yes gene_type:complete
MGKEQKKTLYVQGSSDRAYRQIKHNGFYNLNAITKKSKAFFKKYNYDFTDKAHEEKTKPLGKEAKYEWKAERKATPYIKYTIKVVIEIKNQKEVLIEKRKFQQGNIQIEIKAYMDKNQNQTFKSTNFGEMQRKIYEKFIVSGELKEYEDNLEYESEDLISLIKDQLI